MRYLDLLTALFATVLLVSNVASTKLVVLGPFTFDGGTLLFPLAYIFGDVLTEVYGFRKSRRVIWIGFFALLLAYFLGEFANAYVLAKLKVRTEGRFFWLRALASTLVGQGLDTGVFLLVAFYGVFPKEVLLAVFLSNYAFKLGVEALMLPFTYAVVGFLKRAEGMDAYDRDTDFNPFRLT